MCVCGGLVVVVVDCGYYGVDVVGGVVWVVCCVWV